MLRKRHAPLLLGAPWLAAVGAAAWPFTIDDAFIVARYADRLARGRGYTFVDGPPTDGVTGPLWLAPLTLAAKLGVSPVNASKALSFGASVVAVALVCAFLRERALGRRAVWLALAIAGSSLPLLAWSTAGLETGAAALAVTLLARSVLQRPTPRPLAAGLAAGALAWLRPELLPIAATLLAWLWVRRAPRRFAALAIALCGVLSTLLFRLAWFGHALPMSASAKPPLLVHGLAYVGAALVDPRPLATALVLVALLVFARVGRDARMLGVALAVHALAVVLAGGDWMPARRLFAPVVPIVALAFALAVSRLALTKPRTSAVITFVVASLGLIELIPEVIAMREAGSAHAARLDALAARVCIDEGPVALLDIGALGVRCPNLTILDLGGLTEPHVAYARGAHLDKQIDAAWLRAKAPRRVVLHSRERPRVDERARLRWFAGYPVERRVLSLVQDGYQVSHVIDYAPSYFYVVLARSRQQASETVKGRTGSFAGPVGIGNVRLAAGGDLAP